MFPIKLLLLILAFCAEMVVLLDVGFGKATYLCIIVLGFLQLFSGISGFLHSITFFAPVFILLLVPLTVLRLINDNKNIQHFFERYFNLSFIVFLLFFIYYFYVTKNRELNFIDDFVRWGAKVQEMLRTDKIYTSGVYTIAPADKYPLFSTMLEVMTNIFVGGYSEGSSLFSIGYFGVSLLLPICDQFEWRLKDIPGIILSPMIIIALLLTINNNSFIDSGLGFFNNTYVDWIVGLLFANGFLQCLTFKNKVSDYISFGAICCALIQTDVTSIAFYLIIVVTLLLIMIYKGYYKSHGWFYGCVFVLIVPVALYIGWSNYYHQYDPNVQSVVNSGFLSNYSTLFSRSPVNFVIKSSGSFVGFYDITSNQLDIIKNYFYSIITTPIYSHPLNLTYPMLILVTLCSLLLTYRFHKKDGQILIIALLYLMGAVAYAVAFAYGYAFVLKEYEGIRLAQLGRYMQAYTFPGIIISVLIPMYLLSNRIWCILCLCASCLFIEPQSINDLKIDKNPYIFWEKERDILREYKDLAYNGEKILAVVQNDQTKWYILRYIFNEQSSNLYRFYSYHPDEDIGDFKWWAKNTDSVLIIDSNEAFVNEIWSKVTEYECLNLSMYNSSVVDNHLYFEASYGFEYMIENGQTFAEYLNSN